MKSCYFTYFTIVAFVVVSVAAPIHSQKPRVINRRVPLRCMKDPYAQGCPALLNKLADEFSHEEPLIMSPNEHKPQNVVLPPIEDKPSPGCDGGGSGDLAVSDILGKERTVNIFASLTRGIEPVGSRLASMDRDTTVLAPLNSVITALPHKPWEDPGDYAKYGQETAYAGSEGESRANKNLRHFVEGHIVPQSPFLQGKSVQTAQGFKIHWEERNDKKYVCLNT